ncbi:MAG TPA: hypothetical protein VKF36_10160 [Syntrophorhabdales bacterium]|nr:hypothetical protein [Syntrophorhabdales bacterium]
MRASIIAIVCMLCCFGTHVHADSEEPQAKVESRPAEQADTSPVVIIDPQRETGPQANKDRMLTEEEAYDLVWNLPEVRKEIEKILDQGGVPLATVGMRPAPDSQPGEGNSFYIIRFQGIHAKSIFADQLFYVDAFAGRILVYDSYRGSLISLDDWRRQK